ncbi:Rha family transcriptional regulator [Sphingobacterium hotanense]|uniref:Rha family transcriptional regulator n=1 Tax=Sphingobacterium hotanense TaxID=649196 RepID=A0ABT7NQ28_9SPHI|nr:Rha family transcriptional regulator [Sphingobacterium hotanense]MDM1049364.1 Rha family transcriptional regulator [Sphingobacterium hotanense]
MELTAKQQTITSREIAEMAGKPHNDVLKSIRKMETAWEKVNGGNFSLVDYTDAKGEKRPQYLLTKTETLYIATKFNDEARARLVLRWEELERNDRSRALPPEILLSLDEKIRTARHELDRLIQTRDHLLELSGSTMQDEYIENEGWENTFIDKFGEELYTHIHENIDQWISAGDIPSCDFNVRYALHGVTSQKFLKAISEYCDAMGIKFNPHKVVARRGKTAVRKRSFSY